MATRAPAKGGRYPGAEAFLPQSPRASLAAHRAAHRAAAEACKGCDLYRNATQVVFGDGAARASIMLVGEQPGDSEDREGKPFVGPAGRLLDKALAEAEIDPSMVFTTNAVKHFKWKPMPRGKRRLHQKPSTAEVRACRPWLEREIEKVRPHALVLLGATAGQSLFGPSFRVGVMRGQVIQGTQWAPCVIATVHPSSLLRAPDREQMKRDYEAFVADLRLAGEAVVQVK